MSNMIKLKSNFKNYIDQLNKELDPYFNLVKDYEKYADFSLPRRTMVIYPGGTMQKSWYANRKVKQKKIEINEYDEYDAMSMYLLAHNVNTTTLSAKNLSTTSPIIDIIKEMISVERNVDLSRSEAIVGMRYSNFVLQPHVDGDNETLRYHIIISTCEGNYFRDSDNKVHNLQIGDIWELDVTKQHEVGNIGTTPVKYMIIDAK